MPSNGDDKLSSWNASYYFGVHYQKQEGKSYIGVNLPLGEITCDELLQLGDISKKYGDSKLRTTLSQNLIISGISNEDGCEDAFTLWLGGTLNNDGKFTKNLNYRVKAIDVHRILEKIIFFFQENKVENESFNEFVNRIGISEIKNSTLN